MPQSNHVIFRLTSEPIIEPSLCDDIFCLMVARIEPVGPCHRLVFATPMLSYDNGESDKPDVQVVAKLVLTDEALHTLASAIPQYLLGRPASKAPDKPLYVN